MQTNTPPINEFNADYTVIYGNNRTYFDSAKSWLVGSYTFDSRSLEASSDIYKDHLNKYKSRGTKEVDLSKSNKIRNRIRDEASSGSGILTYEGNPIFEDSPVYNGNPAVVFIDGNLTINKKVQVHAKTALVFVVSGNISVGGNVREIDGFYIANGIFKVDGGKKELVVNGAAMAFSAAGFSLGRDLKDNDEPAERFLYQPRYLWLLKDVLGESTKSFQELTP